MIKTSKEDCCGCEACRQICPQQCITMSTDEKGFLYPIADLSNCINCNMCNNVCPSINTNNTIHSKTSYAAINKNENIRTQSTSGGIFSTIAEHVLSNGGIVFGARFNNEFDVIHDWTDNIEKYGSFRGSKYLQSSIGRCYTLAKKFIEENHLVLFTGTPCQIEGLKRFLNKDYENLITIDIVCHGVTSSLVWQEYLHSKCKSNPTHVNFRSKSTGWKDYSIEIKGKRNYKSRANNDDFIHCYKSNLFLRPSCYKCPSKFHGVSDITLGDYWGIDKVSNLDDDKGTSLIITNTITGEKIIDSIRSKIIITKTDLDTAIQYNPSIKFSSAKHKLSDSFWSDFYCSGHKAIKKYGHILRPPFITRLKILIYNLIYK